MNGQKNAELYNVNISKLKTFLFCHHANKTPKGIIDSQIHLEE